MRNGGRERFNSEFKLSGHETSWNFSIVRPVLAEPLRVLEKGSVQGLALLCWSNKRLEHKKGEMSIYMKYDPSINQFPLQLQEGKKMRLIFVVITPQPSTRPLFSPRYQSRLGNLRQILKLRQTSRLDVRVWRHACQPRSFERVAHLVCGANPVRRSPFVGEKRILLSPLPSHLTQRETSLTVYWFACCRWAVPQAHLGCCWVRRCLEVFCQPNLTTARFVRVQFLVLVMRAGTLFFG